VWNAHNTVFGSKCSVIRAQAVYCLHSTRPSVTWLNSRWRLAACDWAMSALFAVLWTRVGRRRKFGEVSCTECTGHGNDFELIPTVEIKTRTPENSYFGSEFPSICNHYGLTWTKKNFDGSPAVATARIASKICQGQPPTMYSECSRFHPNQFTFGRVIVERVNTAKTRRKLNPIFVKACLRAE